MGETSGIAFLGACAAGLLIGLVFATPASAQPIADDAAAREYFKAGRAAFDQADYESALTYFRHAYRTSGREALLYNIGVAADRLQRDQEALDAFEQYLEKTEKPIRESEVRARIEALRMSIAEKEATERALMQKGVDFQMPKYAEPVDQSTAKKKKRWPWIVAAAAVVVAGGVTAGVVVSQRSKQSQPPSGGFAVNW